MNWYIFFVKTGDELCVKDWLNNTFDRETLYSIVPKRIVPEKKNGKLLYVEKNLFPSYIFVKTVMDFSTYYLIKRNSKIIKMLNYLNKEDLTCHRTIAAHKKQSAVTTVDKEELYFKKIPEEEMSIILKLLNQEEEINFSKVYTIESKVYVESGPLKGLEGIIKKINKHTRRAKVLVSLMGDQRIIELGIEFIEPVGSRELIM
ncbi:antiterminator LoaP [Paenibacillus riograndensis]|uniref:Putative transcription antitermination protein n=1 Tax=Paenibacillus riograndensis SBR5 TaxID=1073571 RepID=A0A0E4H8E3_9BACL|nr:antiterminator LoaP [Paenibacillus riograndensis]CQR54177.1 putative transcription antitermination protein [Paenibacillus riograndensis SBR5]